MNADELRGLFDLSGRTVIITGVTRGIGFALAQGHLAAGANVVVTGRSEERCRAAQTALKSDGTGRVTAIAAHMGDLEQVRNLVEQTYLDFRRHRRRREQRRDIATAAVRRDHTGGMAEVAGGQRDGSAVLGAGGAATSEGE
jgi:NAD(P)-dependent dehydrogenase (short-subunit alcohol dehydrogenase family)